jgi:hypothetical protein
MKSIRECIYPQEYGREAELPCFDVRIQRIMPTAGTSRRVTKREPEDDRDNDNAESESKPAPPSPLPSGTGRLVDKAV